MKYIWLIFHQDKRQEFFGYNDYYSESSFSSKLDSIGGGIYFRSSSKLFIIIYSIARSDICKPIGR